MGVKPVDPAVSEFFRDLARKGGRATSARKAAQARKNGAKASATHRRKKREREAAKRAALDTLAAT